MIVTLRVLSPDGTSRLYEFQRPTVRVGAGGHDDLFLPLDPPTPSALLLEVDEGGVRVRSAMEGDAPVRSLDGAVSTGELRLAPGDGVLVGAPSFRITLESVREQPEARIERHGPTPTPAPLEAPADVRALVEVLRLCAAAESLSELASQMGRCLRVAVPGIRGVGVACPTNAEDRAWRAFETAGSGVREVVEATRSSTGLALDRLHEGEVLSVTLPGLPPVVILPVRDGSAGRAQGLLSVALARSPDDLPDEVARVVAVLVPALDAISAVFARVRRRGELLAQQEENRFFRDRQRQHDLFKDLVTSSPTMRDLHRRLGTLVARDVPALILGEAGAGKEMLARALHHLSPRAEGMLVTLTCTTMDEEPLHSALFGYGGAGAAGRPGAFELARDGTVFLDEVHALSEAAQARLLRALQQSEVFRDGEQTARRISSRLVAATHLDLQAMADEGRFRRDLALLLTRDVLRVPALRDRREDIPGLVSVFVRQFARRYRRGVEGVDAETLAWLVGQEWPGNVRELLTLVERAVLHAPADSTMLTLADFVIVPVEAR